MKVIWWTLYVFWSFWARFRAASNRFRAASSSGQDVVRIISSVKLGLVGSAKIPPGLLAAKANSDTFVFSKFSFGQLLLIVFRSENAFIVGKTHFRCET